MPTEPSGEIPATAPRWPRTGGWLALSLTLVALPVAGIALVPAKVPPHDAPQAVDLADYDLAWRAFLGAGQLDDAITLATQALAAYPDSVLWHRRLASAAEQHNDDALAARNYAWLATTGQQGDQLEHAIALTTATQQFDTAIQLMRQRAAEEPFNADHWKALVAAMLNLGHFDQALSALEQADQRHPREFFLSQQADVLALVGRPEERIAVLRRMIARYGAEPQTILQLASMEYAQGHLEQALATLRQAQATATAHDTAYWQTLSSLAWMLQDFGSAADASRILVRAGTAQADDYQRLYRIHVTTDPAVAYAYALIGWRQTHAAPLFFQALAAANRLDRSALSQTLFASLRPQDRATLGAQPQFWVQWAQVAHREGHDSLARSRYAQALRRAPSDANVMAGYLWLLVDSRDIAPLSVLTRRWAGRLRVDPTVREALTAALALLDQPSRALALLRPDRFSRRDDPAWLMQYADLLDQGDRPDAAQAIRRQAVKPLQRQAASALAKLTPGQREHQVTLISRLRPGDPTRRAMRPLVDNPADASAREQVLAWTIALDSPEATRLWLTRQYATTKAPAWARLSQALTTDNDSASMRLLAADADNLPRRDRVTAANKLGWKSQALTLAYRGLEGEPDDRQLEQQFQKLAVAQADTFGSSLHERHGSGLEAFDAGLDSHTWVTPAIAVDVAAYRFRQTRYDVTQLGTIPAYGQYASAQLVQQLPRGERGLSLGAGRNLAAYDQLGAFTRYRATRNLQLGLAIDYGARVNDTVPLAIAGLMDRLRGTAEYQWSAQDSLAATTTLGRLRAQGGGWLGNRQSLDLEYRHKLWLAPPDFTLIATATDARYQRAPSVPNALLQLVPAGQPADTSFFVPRSYAQACVGVGFNEDFLEAWSDQLRLFGHASACHNSVSGPGASVNAGVATPVLGPDHLSLGLGYSSNTGATSSQSLSAFLNYRYYFTP